MSLLVEMFVKIKYWLLSWFYTPEDILDAWMARAVLSLSPRKVCSRPRLLVTPPSKKNSSGKPPPAPRRPSSPEFSEVRDDSNSGASLDGNEIFPYSPLRSFCVTPCISPHSISAKNPLLLSPSAFFDPITECERCRRLEAVLANAVSLPSYPGTCCSPEHAGRPTAKAAAPPKAAAATKPTLREVRSIMKTTTAKLRQNSTTNLARPKWLKDTRDEHRRRRCCQSEKTSNHSQRFG